MVSAIALVFPAWLVGPILGALGFTSTGVAAGTNLIILRCCFVREFRELTLRNVRIRRGIFPKRLQSSCSPRDVCNDAERGCRGLWRRYRQCGCSGYWRGGQSLELGLGNVKLSGNVSGNEQSLGLRPLSKTLPDSIGVMERAEFCR